MRIAVFGTGQLARMIALEGIAMGVDFSFLKTAGEDSRCVDHLGLVVEQQSGESAAAVYERLGKPDVITTEKEGVDVDFYQQFVKFAQVSPPPKAVWISQNRLREKQFLNEQGVATAAFAPADAIEDIPALAAELGFPVIVKTQENGYDGKGQWWLDTAADVAKMAGAEASGPWLLEKVVPFEREVSVVAARSVSGEVVAYPLAENVHQDGILLTSVAPCEAISGELAHSVNQAMKRLLDALDYVGVLSMECFVTAEGIVANELAPRVHNSGHWTQNALPVGQFEQHVRALLDYPLGGNNLQGAAAMVNLLGVQPEITNVLASHRHFHWYGKEVRAGRKVGHINVQADNHEQLCREVNALLAEIYPNAK